ncbi:MAG: CBS domain-containing protein [Deltaproteobacteria bacterium]|nr:CBS domain-containing protein [Deltaproteobacteria bacterium]
MEDVTVKKIYKTFTVDPPIVSEDSSIEEIIEVLLRDPQSRNVYIVDKQGRLSGIISMQIILKATNILKGKKSILKHDVFNAIKIAKADCAKSIMHPPIYVHESSKILDVLEMMSRENIQELPVVDEHKRVIGDLNCLEILKRVWEA